MNTSKIIKGVVGGSRYTVTAPIMKEDYGLYLQIEGCELPSTYEVDFSNDEHCGTSVTMIGDENGVLRITPARAGTTAKNPLNKLIVNRKTSNLIHFPRLP